MSNQENALEVHAEARITDVLKQNWDVIKAIIPQVMDGKRMAKLVVGAIRQNPKLAECRASSLLNAVMTAMSYGLEIRPGSAYLVPFGGECSLLIDYRGKIDLALRSKLVTGISAEVVCARDTFDCSLGLERKLVHRPLYYRKDPDGLLDAVDEEERGPMVLAYAVARMHSGEPEFIVVSKSDIVKIRDAQIKRLEASRRDVKSSPWVAWEPQMWKKTAVHRLCKLLPQSPEMQELEQLEERADSGNPLPWIAGELKDDGKPLIEASQEAADAAGEKRLAEEQEKARLRAEEARLVAEKKNGGLKKAAVIVDDDPLGVGMADVSDARELSEDEMQAEQKRQDAARESKPGFGRRR